MIACPSCRVGRKGYAAGKCIRCGTEEINFGSRITLPKKNNKKAWDLIVSGDLYWDKHKAGKGPQYAWRGRPRTLDAIRLDMAKRMLSRWSQRR